jgi:hypothetical protein
MNWRSTPLLFAAIVLTLSATARAQEHKKGVEKSGAVSRPVVLTVRLGNSVVVIPAPEGFEEASSQFDSIKARFTETEAPGNEMLAVHLPASDCELLRRGEQTTFNSYTKISVLRDAKEQVFSESDLAALVAEFRKNGATMMDPNGPRMKALLEHIEQGLKKVESGDTQIDMSQPVNLGELEVSPRIYSVMMLMTITRDTGATQSSTPLLAGVTFMRVKQRLIYVFTYRKYHSKSDVEALRVFTKTWTGGILAAN